MVPVTFLYDWEYPDDHARESVLAEFAANGAKCLVLTDTLLSMIAGNAALYRILPKQMEKAGLRFADAHAPFGNDLDLSLPVPEARPQMLLRHKLNLQLVSDFGVDTCCFHLGTPVHAGYNLDQYRDAVRDSLETLLPEAERLGITLCIENVCNPVSTVKELLMYRREFPTPALGFCYDSGHANIMERGKAFPGCQCYKAWSGFGEIGWETDVLQALHNQVVNCHLHDNNGWWDVHELPGSGTVDWSKVIPELLSCPRLKCIQSEVIPVRTGTPVRKLCDTFFRLLKG